MLIPVLLNTKAVHTEDKANKIKVSAYYKVGEKRLMWEFFINHYLCNDSLFPKKVIMRQLNFGFDEYLLVQHLPKTLNTV